jgi:L-lactate dehydrogenase (cytochrome)/(S)-mandelate dehydrogenase
MRRNRAAFRKYQLLPRYLVDVSTRDQSTELLGRRYASPFGISPTGLAGLFHPGADELLAQAAKAANIPFLLSSASNASLETVAKLAPDHVWFQIYGTRDERINADLVKRARDAGVRTLVVSVDVPVNSNRERNKRNGFSRPFRMTPAVAFEALGHPAWVLRYLRSGGIPMMRNWAPYGRAGATAAEVADLYAWTGPLAVKGLLHPDDARQAADLGVDALIVSNHGGRQLDTAPSPVEMLPAIRAAVGDRVELMLDSGVRRGSDIVIARCLGARFATFGRPTLFGAAAGGAAGIARALQIVRNEIDMVMAQIGCSAFDALDSRYLRLEGSGHAPGPAGTEVREEQPPPGTVAPIPNIRRQR